MNNPNLSIVVPAFNAQNLLERFFRSIKSQRLDGKKIEILFVDGGSTDRTLEIARTYGVRIIHNPKKLAEPGVALGIENARSDLIMVLALDNIFRSATSIRKMISVFDNTDIIAAFPKHDTGENDSVFSRYYNTFTDPYTHFIYGYAANARTFHKIYRTILHSAYYDVYDYSSNPMFPLIALAQGFTVRKSVLKNRSDQFDDVLVIYTLIGQGKHIAYVHGVSLYHYTADNVRVFMQKQQRAVENALLRGNSGISIRTEYLTDWQKIKRIIFFPYSLSVLFPLVIACIQLIRTGDTTWLLHPFMVYLSAIAILSNVAVIAIKKIFPHQAVRKPICMI